MRSEPQRMPGTRPRTRPRTKPGTKPKTKGTAGPPPKPSANPQTIDLYLSALGDDQRAALERLRKIIRAAVPRADECISYRLPAFRLDGRVLVWFGAASNHCAFYPGAVVQALQDELKGYDTSKGTIRFQPSKPLPAALVRKLVKARIAADAAARGRTGTARAARRR